MAQAPAGIGKVGGGDSGLADDGVAVACRFHWLPQRLRLPGQGWSKVCGGAGGCSVFGGAGVRSVDTGALGVGSCERADADCGEALIR